MQLNGDWKISYFAVQETGVSRHNGAIIKDPSQTLQYNSAVMYEGLQGNSQLIPRDIVSRPDILLITIVFPDINSGTVNYLIQNK